MIEGGGLRLFGQSFDPQFSDRAKIEVALIGRLPRSDGTFIDLMDFQPDHFDLMRVNGEWKIIRDEQKVTLTVFDDDSEAVAKQMMQMDPKTLEQLKADPRLPLRPLRVYEELKAKAVK